MSYLKRCFISGHIAMYGIKLSSDILSPFPDQWKLLIEKTSSVQNVSRSLAGRLSSSWKSDWHKELDQLRTCRASLRWMNEIQVLLESVCVLMPRGLRPGFHCDCAGLLAPLHRSKRSWAFSVNGLFGGPLSGVSIIQQTLLFYKDVSSYNSLQSDGGAANDCKMNILSSFTPELK